MNFNDISAYDFVKESNKIEGIIREPYRHELDEYERFMELEAVTIPQLKQFVSVYQPDARLRDNKGLNVRVGNHYPIAGGPEVVKQLAELLLKELPPFETHVAFETLHPFSDCNGRSGRMLWAWQMKNSPRLALGFLHSWYYQSLSHSR